MERNWRQTNWPSGVGWFLASCFSALFCLIVGRAIVEDYPYDSTEVREWVGALSGWAAAIAAGFTLRYLERQTRLAESLREEETRRFTERRRRQILNLMSDLLDIRNEAIQALYGVIVDSRNPPIYNKITAIEATVFDREGLSIDTLVKLREVNQSIRDYNALIGRKPLIDELNRRADVVQVTALDAHRHCTMEVLSQIR